MREAAERLTFSHALRALANATAYGAGSDSETQKSPDLARAQRGRLQPGVRRQPSFTRLTPKENFSDKIHR